MTTMNISLPDALKSFVDEQAVAKGYGSSREYDHDLIRQDRDRQRLRALLLRGAASEPVSHVDGTCFDHLRNPARRSTTI